MWSLARLRVPDQRAAFALASRSQQAPLQVRPQAWRLRKTPYDNSSCHLRCVRIECGCARDWSAYCEFQFRHVLLELRDRPKIGVIHIQRCVLAVEQVEDVGTIILIRDNRGVERGFGLRLKGV